MKRSYVPINMGCQMIAEPYELFVLSQLDIIKHVGDPRRARFRIMLKDSDGVLVQAKQSLILVVMNRRMKTARKILTEFPSCFPIW